MKNSIEQNNRVVRDLAWWNAREHYFSEQQQTNLSGDKKFRADKIAFLTSLVFKYRFAALTADEKFAISSISAQIRELRQATPGWKPKGLLGLVVAAVKLPFKVALGTTLFMYRTIEGIHDLYTMNKRERANADRLNHDLAKLGFGPDIPQLSPQNTRGHDKLSFRINEHPTTGERIDWEVRLRRENGDLKIHQYEGNLRLPTGEVRRQVFNVSEGSGFTVQEAYHLLSGRAVNRQFVNAGGQVSSGWVALDFSEKDQKGNFRFQSYGDRYGYDLGAVLDNSAIVEARLPAKRTELAQQLQRGERAPVHLRGQGGRQVPCFVEADLATRSLRYFDGQGKPATPETILGQSNTQNKQASVKDQHVIPAMKTSVQKKPLNGVPRKFTPKSGR